MFRNTLLFTISISCPAALSLGRSSQSRKTVRIHDKWIRFFTVVSAPTNTSKITFNLPLSFQWAMYSFGTSEFRRVYIRKYLFTARIYIVHVLSMYKDDRNDDHGIEEAAHT
eukprot:gene314-176_t